jgi:hypothetical protein
MVDKILAYYNFRKEKPLDSSYKPENAINSRQFIDAGNDRLAIIFPGWHTHNFPINVLTERLVRKGWSVLWYDYNDQILEPDEKAVVESMRYIRDTACDDIQKLISQKPYRRIHFISISLGGVPMALVCDKLKHFSSVTAVVGGDDLAVDMWHGFRTQKYKVAFEKMHIGIRKLAKDWDNIGPDHHLRHFKGKPVKLVMSKHDTYVPTKSQLKLARELETSGAQLKLKKRFTGHSLTILRYCLFDNPI